MQIYNSKDGLYIQAYEEFDNNKRYKDEYLTRMETTPYYNYDVFLSRKKWVEDRINIEMAFDYGAGLQPYYKNIECNKQPLGIWDKYVEPYTKFELKNYMKAETIMLYDVIEHIYDVHSFLQILPQTNLIMSIPCVPYSNFNSMDQIKTWRHFRAGEHLLYANKEGIFDILQETGWNIIDSGEFEAPIRQDILCILATRK